MIQNIHRSKIHKLRKTHGGQEETRGDIEEELVQHFRNVMNENQDDRQHDIKKITQHISRVATQEHNEMMKKPLDIQEVEEAMNQMTVGKVSGLDGFTTNFFHCLWYLIKQEMWEVVEELRQAQGVLTDFNATFLTLIPKSEGEDRPGKFKPIALCNAIYKIISKVIANRLKLILPIMIGPEQSGFVEGRQILDGIILVHESFHSLKLTKNLGMMVKLDIAKYYAKLS